MKKRYWIGGLLGIFVFAIIIGGLYLSMQITKSESPVSGLFQVMTFALITFPATIFLLGGDIILLKIGINLPQLISSIIMIIVYALYAFLIGVLFAWITDK